MTAHAVLVANSIQAIDIGAFNRSAICSGSDLDNGNVVRLDSISSTAGLGEVWVVTKAATTGSLCKNLWMVDVPENPAALTADGEIFLGLSEDPRNHYNLAGAIVDVFKVKVGDIVTLTADAFTGAKGASDVYANAGDASFELAWSTTQAADSLSFAYLATTYIPIGNAAVSSGRVTAYKLVCVAE